ncbi:response regulator [Paenibacillus sp. LHD-117]|uniref:response regulator transcription factor n=1 Tax=Paenibacillus sp. LHD-117 TaxID=3071412 RepID=UPI0027E0139C|nr:response regulator [Paenibacillus sp. LHD-117]MDQ6421457.1 response regulator [Paenibacillus sp. LHD-117]
MRIVVVEDEVKTRQGIIRLIQKISKHEVVGEAENGLIGLEIITELKPDLVIVDVKMPKMNGLEMLAELKNMGIRHKNIILSGFTDFEYAQKAIKVGVNEYLLKPIEVDDLKKTLDNIEIELMAEKELQLKKIQGLETVDYLFQNLIFGNINNETDLLNRLKNEHSIDNEQAFIAISVYMPQSNDIERDEVRRSIVESIQRFEEIKYYDIELSVLNEIVFLVHSSESDHILERHFQKEIFKAIRQKYEGNMIIGWIGFTGIEHFRESLQTIRKEFKWSIVLGEDVLICYPNTLKTSTKLMQYPVEIENNIKSAVFKGDIQLIQEQAERFMLWCQRDKYQPTYVIEAFTRFSSALINALKEFDQSLYEELYQNETLKSIMDAITWNELKGIVQEIVEKITARRKNGDQIYGMIIKKALGQIEERYREGISLEEVASKLGITPEYLSSQFNREVGRNFTAYVKEFRIRKAKELLMTKNLKTYEVADLVGYNDPKYFCRVFKEITGLSPGYFQKSNQ